MLGGSRRGVLLGDSRKCQTLGASPAKPGGLLTTLAGGGVGPLQTKFQGYVRVIFEEKRELPAASRA
jgi:hypothetical protein